MQQGVGSEVQRCRGAEVQKWRTGAQVLSRCCCCLGSVEVVEQVESSGCRDAEQEQPGAEQEQPGAEQEQPGA
jgi:hypothetical protein